MKQYELMSGVLRLGGIIIWREGVEEKIIVEGKLQGQEYYSYF